MIRIQVQNHGVAVDYVVADLGRVWNGGSAQAGLQGGTCSLVTQMINGHLVTASQALTEHEGGEVVPRHAVAVACGIVRQSFWQVPQ